MQKGFFSLYVHIDICKTLHICYDERPLVRAFVFQVNPAKRYTT